MMDKDILYLKIVALIEIYKFLVLSFVVWGSYNVKFWQHINWGTNACKIKYFLYGVG
jgi:hypothetical protein